jgi:hypothetical protein
MTERFGHLTRAAREEIDTMLSKAAFGLAIVLAATSGSLAATKTQVVTPHHSQNIYGPAGAYLGWDPDARVRFELNRDWARDR